MLWIGGAVTLIVWFVARFLLHKGPTDHLLLVLAVALFVVQFVQDQRTRAYRADR